MKQYVCSICGYIYDERKGDSEAGIEPGTKWEDLPEDWVCPLCVASKDDFVSNKLKRKIMEKFLKIFNCLSILMRI